jgi:hypothetical protein
MGMRCAGHVACMGGRGMCARFWLWNLKEREHLKGLSIDMIIIIKWFLNV